MSEVKIKLISHASVLIEAPDITILTDPWFFGTAFNDGWELYPIPNLEKIDSIISDIDIIWISHEHPDHFHFPTLKYLNTRCKNDVKIAFQSNNSQKVFNALKSIGFNNFLEMPHLKKIRVSNSVELGCYAHRHLDSSLAVFVNDFFWLLNINDTELNDNDLMIVKNYWGKPYSLLNQFSIAGSNGIENSLVKKSALILDKMISHHIGLEAQITVPFASFVRFARSDNDYMNKYSNKPIDAKARFDKEGLKLVLLSYESNELVWDNLKTPPSNLNEVHEMASSNFLEIYKTKHLSKIPDEFDYAILSNLEVKSSIEKKLNEWSSITSGLFWRRLHPVYFKVTDWRGSIWCVDFKNLSFNESTKKKDYDISISSQPLNYAFSTPFGIQTLGVSGRYKFNPKYKNVPLNWRLLRILSSLYNSGIHISLIGITRGSSLRWIWGRRIGIIAQIKQQWIRFFP
jgi:UDP-MurNAc hydroxylase